MALIEYLERGDWRGVLRRSFEGAISWVQLALRDRCNCQEQDTNYIAMTGLLFLK